MQQQNFDTKNLIIAVVLTILVLTGFDYFFKPAIPQQIPHPELVEGSKAQSIQPTIEPAKIVDRTTALNQTPRVQINTPKIKGSIALKGGRIDDVMFKKYRLTQEKNSGNVVLFSPSGTDNAQFADYGWISQNTNVRTPNANTIWQTSAQQLTPEKPVTLTWNNGQGLLFKRTFSIDENYMIKVNQSVTNNSIGDVSLSPYGLISRVGGSRGEEENHLIHTGPIGVSNGELIELSYEDIKEEITTGKSETGWIGITDKYWLASIAPDPQKPFEYRFTQTTKNNKEIYQADFHIAPEIITPGQTAQNISYLFAGAKEIRVLDQYVHEHGIDHLDLAVDFGWFYFLTKPMLLMLIAIESLVGNYGLAIILLTILVKLLMFPLANKSYRSMNKLKELQPEMERIRKQYKDDRTKQGQEMARMYGETGVNPASGCLPLFIQIPVFFSLYKVLYVAIEMRHAPFFGWVQDLSAPDPTNMFTLFGLIPITLPGLLHIGVWPLLMGITMWLQQRLNPTPMNNEQAKMFQFMPILFTFLLARFPAGLVIYWTCSNLWGIVQQWAIKREPKPKTGAKKHGKKPKKKK